MVKENCSCPGRNEKTATVTTREGEYLETYRECGSVAAVADLHGVHSSTVIDSLRNVARKQGVPSIKHLLPEDVVFKRSMRSRAGTATASQLMELIEKQSYRCALSGVALNPGIAALDHKIAVSNGGDDSIGNLHWVSNGVNKAKGTMGCDEFIEMCKQVASWCR